MFDIGFAELLLIGIIALIVIGPKRLPEASRFLGYWTGKLRRTIGDARREMEREFGIDEIKREVHNTLLLEQLDKERRQVEEQFSQTKDAPPGGSNTTSTVDEEDPEFEDMDFIDDDEFPEDLITDLPENPLTAPSDTSGNDLTHSSGTDSPGIDSAEGLADKASASVTDQADQPHIKAKP